MTTRRSFLKETMSASSVIFTGCSLLNEIGRAHV